MFDCYCQIEFILHPDSNLKLEFEIFDSIIVSIGSNLLFISLLFEYITLPSPHF